MSLSKKDTGKVIFIGENQQISESFNKREFVVEFQDGQYSQPLKFELIKDKVSLIDAFKVGQEATVYYNMRGRAWEKDNKTTYFNSLLAWKITTPETTPQDVKTGGAPNPSEDEGDDLPF